VPTQHLHNKKGKKMGIIIQIGLTALAFYRGWRWYALIPAGVAFCLGLLVGAATAGAVNPGAHGFLIMADILSMIALAIMCFWVPPGLKDRNERITKAIEEAKQPQ
jgi:hypothetical protein